VAACSATRFVAHWDQLREAQDPEESGDADFDLAAGRDQESPTAPHPAKDQNYTRLSMCRSA
jgi:hypothetical protein